MDCIHEIIFLGRFLIKKETLKKLATAVEKGIQNYTCLVSLQDKGASTSTQASSFAAWALR